MADMCRRVVYLRRHGSTSETPLSSYKKGIKWQHIRGDDITAAIRAAVRAAGLSIRFTEADISAHSLHEEGDIAILMARVEPDTIRLVGRWRSDTILYYIHTTAKSFTRGLSANMLKHGACALILPAHSGN